MMMGAFLILLGVGGIVLGVRGWSQKRDLVDSSVLDVTVTERQTSPLLAALGGIALVTGLVMLRARRDRTPV
jgi:hypothetical protein